ncbi:MAG: hypothetical protein D6721_05770 [Gammaproteobacteria bacterium]|nr:MAG: hypothetical protein D6721_05770 [Gammaproteobacteria bacterium]
MRTWVLLLLPFLCLGLSGHASARDLNGRYAVFGIGEGSCRDFLEARHGGGAELVLYEQWIAGHISAYNLLLAHTYNLLGDLTPTQLLTRIDAQCTRTPDRPFVQALARVLETLYGQRANFSRDAPSGWRQWLKAQQQRKGETEPSRERR